MALCCGLAASAQAADGAGAPMPGGAPHERLAPAAAEPPLLDFQIPAQPLPAALGQFARVTGRSALFPSPLVNGRDSSPVRGRYTPRAALHILLEGTGLDAEEISVDEVTALVLKPAGPQAPAAAAEATAADAAGPASDGMDGYDSLIQMRIWEALCANPRTAQRSYRSVLRFGVDSAGRIGRARLLRSTGDGPRDAALLEVLHRVRIGRPPPAAMEQPVTMLILPEQDGGAACGASAAERFQP